MTRIKQSDGQSYADYLRRAGYTEKRIRQLKNETLFISFSNEDRKSLKDLKSGNKLF